MTVPRITLVTVGVSGPSPNGWRWAVTDPNNGYHQTGLSPTEEWAWEAARVETALVLSRLECTAAGRAALDEANT